MKKLLALCTVLVLALTLCGVSAFAEAPEGIGVYVSLSDDRGNLVLVREAVTVTDRNGDGVFSVDEALYAAHEAHFAGGAADGYASSVTAFGISLDKLWGISNGGAYGYYLNHASAWSLNDPIQEGDHLKAYVYTDLSGWSDAYCHFDVDTKTVQQDTEFTLTLSSVGWGSDGNPEILPVQRTFLTVNGETTDFITDGEGKVTLQIDQAGSFLISAVSDTQTLVPPICQVTVVGNTAQTDPEEQKNPTSRPDKQPVPEKEEHTTNPCTEDTAPLQECILLAALASSGICLFGSKRHETK